MKTKEECLLCPCKSCYLGKTCYCGLITKTNCENHQGRLCDGVTEEQEVSP
jgi:hypothetical protein